MNNKKGIFEKVFYNNKFLLVFSFILAVSLWAVVKINFSDNTTRTISDVKVTIDSSLSEETDFVPFINQEDLYVDVQVSGKSYNIDSYSLSKSDIIVEATTGYVDTAGYKVLNLTARTTDGDVSVTGIYPSTITVFLDRKTKGTFNVEAKLNNELDTLSDSPYVVGQPVASMTTVEVSGPATVIENLKKVIFEATLDEADLPLTATKEVTASVSYSLEKERGSQFLVCEGIEEKTNPATITIPVSKVKTVSTAVKFINEPAVYETESPKVRISPSKVKITYNTQDDEELESLTVGTIDFRQLNNTVNKFEFTLDDKTVSNIADSDKTTFTVSVDMSSKSKKFIDEIPAKVVLVNQAKGYNYDVSLENGGLDEIVIIGSSSSLKKISVDDLQVEINVSSLDVNKKTAQKVEISNISISTEGVDDCWIYGNYYAYVTVSAK